MASTWIKRDLSVSETVYKYTWSAWIKRGSLGVAGDLFKTRADSNNWVQAYLHADNSMVLQSYKNGGYHYDFKTTQKFRDTTGWYHFVFNVDSSQSTAGDRVRMYVNGERITAFDTSNNNLTNGDSLIINGSDSGQAHTIGSWNNGSYFDGCMSHVHYSSGYSYAPTVFGETDATTGEWKINTNPTFTLGGNGYTVLKDGNTITDQSSNSNDFTVGGGTLTKTEDCPSNVFPTLNPLLTHAAHGYSLTYGLGNNKITFNEPSTWTYTTSTIAGINGKFYAEFKIDAVGSESSIGVIASDTVNNNQTSGGLDDYLGKETDSIGYLNDGRTFKNNSAQQTGLTAISAGNILGVALDTENNTCQFYINGSSSGNPVSLTADKFYHFGVSGYNGTQISCNFGNGYFGTTAVSSAGTNASNIGIFEYNVPTGFTALSTKGLNL